LSGARHFPALPIPESDDGHEEWTAGNPSTRANMSKKILGISWLNGRFHAAALHGSVVSASWASPQPVPFEADFAEALAEAVRQTGFTGTQVVVVLDHGSLLFHVEETPPAKGRVLKQLLERRVAQNHFFEEQAAWGRLDLPLLKGRQRTLLALAPKSLVQHLTTACAALRLNLAALVPTAAVLGPHLRELSVPAEETVVLATDLGGSLHLLLGRGDGQVLFSRSVVLGGTLQSDRAAQEIARTLHYAQQQFSAAVNHLFVFGSAAFAALKDVQIRSGLRVQPGPVAEDPFYFARQAGLISRKSTVNLVSPSETQRQRVRGMVAAGLAAAVVLSATTTVVVERTVRARERAATQLERQLAAEGNAEAVNRSLRREASRLDAFLRLVGSTNDAPMAGLFARYLPSVAPETIHFTEAAISRGPGGWEVYLNGSLREQSLDYLAMLEQFERQLQDGPCRIQITDSTHQQILQGTAEAAGPAVRRSGRPGDEKPFFVKGRIP
jgi:hypothetical protein